MDIKYQSWILNRRREEEYQGKRMGDKCEREGSMGEKGNQALREIYQESNVMQRISNE